MTDIYCQHCGQKIGVPLTYSEKEGKCPRCKKPLVASGTKPAYDLTLLDIPKLEEKQQAYDHTVKAEAIAVEKPDETYKRRFPWLIDIFLYPMSKAGLMNLGVIVLIPFLLGILIKLLSRAVEQYMFLLIVYIPLLLLTAIIVILLSLYLLWYLCECIRDSADGDVRAPQVLIRSFSFADVFWQNIRIILCILLFTGPAIIYYMQNKEPDVIFWALIVYAVMFFPMSLLATVMFESLSGVNPILLFGSIISTFFPYFALVSVFILINFTILERMPILQNTLVSNLVKQTILIYLGMISAHLLGWFFHRYENELNWDV